VGPLSSLWRSSLTARGGPSHAWSEGSPFARDDGLTGATSDPNAEPSHILTVNRESSKREETLAAGVMARREAG
jgi:hypothetical protein